MEKFSKENYGEYFKMRDYATISGVVQADRVIVPTSWMRENYIEKLVEFAGLETKEELPEIWDVFLKMIAVYESEVWLEILKERDRRKMVEIADAYYGDSERLALELLIRKQLIMIQNDERGLNLFGL